MNLHYGDKYDDAAYNDILVRACADNGIAAFTGDGTNPQVMLAATAAIGEGQGSGGTDGKAVERGNGSRENEAGQKVWSLCGGYGY